MISSAQTTRRKCLVSPRWLQDHLDKDSVHVVDVRSPDAYGTGHIPDALNVPLSVLQATRDGVPEMLADQAQFEARMGGLGITETDTVVIYDDMWGMPAARVLWSLERYGHDEAYLLDGGLDAWKAQDRPLTTESPTLSSAIYQAVPVDDRVAPHGWLRAHLGDPDVVVVDTRTVKEYGEGHVPGAVNWDWQNAVPFDGSSSLRPDEALRTELEELGVTPDKEIVAYCQTGARSAHFYFTLRHLGYPRVRNYDGSWVAWSSKEVDRE